MSYCPYCGKKQSDGAVFCENCGKRLPIPSTPKRNIAKPVSTDKGILFAVIAATCYTVCVLLNVTEAIYFGLKYSNHVSVAPFNIIAWTLLMALAVTIFIRKRAAFICPVVAENFLSLYLFLKALRVYNLGELLADVSLLVLLILAVNRNPVVKKFWFIPGIFEMLAIIIMWIQFPTTMNWTSAPQNVLYIAAVFMAGLWNKEEA